MSSVTFDNFQNGQASGLTVVVGFAILSLAAVDFVWLRVLWVALNRNMQKVAREKAIFTSQLGAYVVCLLLSNLLSSVSFIMNITWIVEGGVLTGSLCSSQAALGQIADVATAYFTAAIAVHTFNSLVLHHRLPLWFCSVAVAFGWVAAIVIAIAPTKMQLKSGPFYSTDGLSCVISREYPMLVTVLHLIPIFLSAFVSVLFYSLVFLILRGTLTIRGGLKLNLDIEARRSTMHGALEYPKFIAAIARSMLWYPVVYVIFMFPHVIICLLQASGASVSISLEALGLTCTAMLGLANVSVFYNTVRIMGPAFGDSSTSSVKSEKSFSSPHKAESPVDVAPPVAAFIAPKAFPPPRSITPRPSMETLRGSRPTGHGRQKSAGSESMRHLIPSQQGHSHTASTASAGSTMTTESINRPIASMDRLNQMVTVPLPTAQKSSLRVEIGNVSDSSLSLPAPPRNTRSPVLRRPTLPSIASPPLDNSMLSAVPLKTPLPGSDNAGASQRDSFIKMYASQSALPQTATFMPPSMFVNDGDRITMPTFSPGSNSSPGFSSDSDSELPRSAFGERVVRPRPSRSFRVAVEQRLSTVDVPESGGLSSLAWATLVTDAATSNGGTDAAAKMKASRRRSKSMESLRVPSALQPRTPISAKLRRERTMGFVPPRSAMGESRYPSNSIANAMYRESRATFRDGPSKTPTYMTSSETMRQF